VLEEPTTLASVAFRVADTLRSEYDVDFLPTLEAIGIDLDKRTQPGARVVRSKQLELWREAVEQSGDEAVGLVVGRLAEPRDYYVLGHAWLAATTLHDAMTRLVRLRDVLSNMVSELTLSRDGSYYVLKARYPDPERMPIPTGIDAGISSLLRLCEISAGKPVLPLRAELIFPDDWHPDAYQERLQCPIRFDAGHNALWFPADVLEEPLPGAVPEVLECTDRIAVDYIASFDRSQVATQVRSLIYSMLPSGQVDQETIAGKLYRSPSTLQRQLSAEGTSFRDLLQSTRQGLAEQYLKEGRHSQAEIAFMVGFSDQSNFARAFKRWTGESPGQYQRSS
jgi:AraC-like DNA-binding protein